jgi:PPOX class probable F420-dependent enzyme
MIALTDDERRRYLADAATIILVSIGRDGYPHAVPMWFTVDDDGRIAMTTYARSQKTLNVRRNPKVALLVESGEHYEDLKGVLLRGTAEVVDDLEECVRVLTRIQTKHLGELGPEAREVMRAQARKRIVLRITPERVASWDHRKLGGVY